jgi:hypothetical protein
VVNILASTEHKPDSIHKVDGMAGGFGIQSPYVLKYLLRGIEGDPFTVVGLPVLKLVPVFQLFGISMNPEINLGELWKTIWFNPQDQKLARTLMSI